MAVSSPVRRLGNTDAAMQSAPRRSAGSRSIVTPANSGPDIEGARGDFAAMEADVVQGAVVKRTQLRDGATRRHPLGEARECPSGAARHQAGYEVGRSHGAGAPGKLDGEFGHVDPPEYCCQPQRIPATLWRRWAQSFEAVWIFCRGRLVFCGACTRSPPTLIS